MPDNDRHCSCDSGCHYDDDVIITNRRPACCYSANEWPSSDTRAIDFLRRQIWHVLKWKPVEEASYGVALLTN